MILVTGAKGVVGQPLVDRLETQGTAYLAVSRQAPESEKQIQWDLSCKPKPEVCTRLKEVVTLIHCAPIWLLPEHLDTMREAGINRLVVFSSTSVLSKQSSANSDEQQLVERLASSETSLIDFCSRFDMLLTILRPSLIYGYGRDQNVSHIAHFIKRYGFFVLVGKAAGLRQPVHADDLVTACLDIIDKPITTSKIYNLAGGEILSYRAMVHRIFNGLGKSVKVITVPLFLFRSALTIAAKLGRFSYTPEMANRMAQDLNYDYSEASKDFSYQPQKFLTQPKRDLIK